MNLQFLSAPFVRLASVLLALELADTDGNAPPVEASLIEGMAEIREGFPTDLEAGTLYGESLVLRESLADHRMPASRF